MSTRGNPMSKSIVTQAAVAVVIGLGIIGCSSQQTRTANEAVEIRKDAVSSLDSMRAQLVKADAQIYQTQASLNNLVSYQGDLPPMYSRFATDVEKTKGISDQISTQTNSMSQRSARYTNDWNYKSQDIRNNDMRKDSLDRQASARSQQDQLISHIDDFRGAYLAYIQRLEDAQAFAATNLSAEGMQRLKSHTQTVADAARTAREKIRNLEGELTQVASAWRATTPTELQTSEPQPAGAEMNPATRLTTQPMR